MKNQFRIALLLAGVMLFGGVSYAAVPDDPVFPGVIFRQKGDKQDQPTRVYQLVRFAGQGNSLASLSKDAAVVWDTNSADGVTVRMATTSGDGAFAGIVVSAIPTADNSVATTTTDDDGRRNWGYIQTYGFYPSAIVVAGGTNANSAGDVFITSSDAGAITSYQGNVGSDQAGFARKNGRGGFFLAAGDGTSTRVGVFIKAL